MSLPESGSSTPRQGKAVSWFFPEAPADTTFAGFEEACAHYPATDFPLFCHAYAELCRVDLSGGLAIELACGRGDLAVCLARRFPKARIVAVDRYPEAGAAIREAHARGQVPNLEYHCGDAMDLAFVTDGTADLVFGQAALHHLAHSSQALSIESSRALKPGGRLLFLFEPLGHNWAVACVRAIQVSRHEMCDESNLFDSVFREILRNFSSCEVQSFNLSGYFLKGIPGGLAVKAARLANQLDRFLAETFPKAALFGANGNIVFVK
ncbi:MAG: class I SAM-dependent methyltransferase [Terrimicrobiaceae bacterium]